MAGTTTDETAVPGRKAPHVEGDVVHVERSAVRKVEASQVSLEKSAAWTVRADHATLHRSQAGVVVTRSFAGDQSRATILVSPVVRGEVHTWVDLRTAFAAGVGFFAGKLILDMMRSLGRRLTR